MPESTPVTDAPHAGPHAGRAREALGSDLRIATARLTRRMRAQRGEAELPDHLFTVLALLFREGPSTPGALAEHECIRPPSMTRSVNALVDLGFVSKIEHPTDGRQVVVELTDAGRREVHETRRRRDAWLTRRLAELTADERRTLAAASELMTRVARS
ncbi:MarR family winged helix-turn-helix transcriptional regulator [Cellulomonas sp. PhB143]|uniref:MarR family winged helix-turn-helix transcriptional regulator n=1 Tax=Cellulomonas sp. PhB143 TaxID=2485186 RepID=UPI000F45F586|nr:MarR family transcriptional regulator [Cellulomonas sp. PhB143]ROS78745.1 DNA-binding MarR family transcriptional regulator [Cellulomonas sp. PhB143]